MLTITSKTLSGMVIQTHQLILPLKLHARFVVSVPAPARSQSPNQTLVLNAAMTHAPVREADVNLSK